MKIEQIIKPYDTYTYDDILDKYNETKNSKFLSYCYVKSNNISVIDLIRSYGFEYERILFLLFNIQRELDGLEPAKTNQEMYKIMNLIINVDKDDLDDFLDSEEYDF